MTRPHMEKADPNDIAYWCPSPDWDHFHAWDREERCAGCNAPIYDAQDGTGRYKSRVFIIEEEPV